ncbi:MAG: hypothetical protein HFJ12_04990 [Bacilli bacterium]|nr:hypothetical protein [Bacilli bacterium]
MVQEKISDYSYQELYQLDFGSWLDKKFKSEHIVLFEDFAKKFLNLDLTFAIELKVDGIEKEVLNIINKYKIHDKIFLISFNYRILQNIRKLDKNIKLAWLIDKINLDSIKKLLKITGNQICPNAKFVTKDGITLAKSNQLDVRLWGIHEEKIMSENI